MRIASGIVVGAAAGEAGKVAEELERQVFGGLGSAAGQRVDLLLVFVSAGLAEEFGEIVAGLRRMIRPRHVLGVTAESVIGADQEAERGMAVSVLAMVLGERVGVHPFHLSEEDWAEVIGDEEGGGALRERVGSAAGEVRAFLVFADPFTTPAVQLMEAWSRQFPEAPVIGGMASGMQAAGQGRMALDGVVYRQGAVGVALSGGIVVDCVVSQGCRPVGETHVITKAEGNVVRELDGMAALAAIEKMLLGLPLHDRQLIATKGLLIGRVIDEGKGNFGKGDFLIRSLVGVRREEGAILIGDMVRVGQTLQFQVRDAKTAEAELRLLLEGETILGGSPSGVLLVTCNGRGTRLFDMPHHDVTLARQVLGDVPIAGFFAAGELGPVGDRNYIHGHTAAMALFRPPAEAGEG